MAETSGQIAAVRIEADGGSRGNPGRAAYGAVLFDATTGAVIAERAETIGIATNNVAEYSGLIAGLELYQEHAPGAALEVRMDSKLVIEQMSGRWKIKHPDMKPLALRANRLAPSGTRYVWIPREQNTYADRILNRALDQDAAVESRASLTDDLPEPPAHRSAPEVPFDVEDTLFDAAEVAAQARPGRGKYGPDVGDQPTTIVLVRHGETRHTRERRFSGLGGDDPELNEHGRAQVQATADWLKAVAGEVAAIVSSPLRRTRETAAIISQVLGIEVSYDDGIAEAGFGSWDALTFAEARTIDPEGFDAWIGNPSVRAGGDGESTEEVDLRVAQARERLLTTYAGQTIVAVAHVTPIKLLMKQALDLDYDWQFKTELAPASVTVLAWYPDGRAVLRMFNGGPVFPSPRPDLTHN